MINFAIIENDLVTNVVVAESQEIANLVAAPLIAIELKDNAGIGWSYINGKFVAPPQPPEYTFPLTPEELP